MAAALITCLAFAFVYNGANYLAAQRDAAGLPIGLAAFSWEHLIPFCPVMVIPYWSIDLFFILAPFFVDERQALRLYIKRVILGILVAGAFFVAFPLRLAFVRPPVDFPLSLLFSALDNFNNFYNLAPSLHIILRSILWTVYVPATSGFARRSIQFWFALIGVSTLLVYQHQVIDVFTGQVVALLVLRLTACDFEPLADPNSNLRQNARRDLAAKYFAGALAFVLLSWFFWLPGVIFLWPAASLFAVGCGYWSRGPAIFNKVNARIGWAERVLFFPYLIGRTIAFKLYTRSGAPTAMLTDAIWFGRRLESDEQSLLPPYTVAILDLTAEFSEPRFLRRLDYLNIQVLDLTLPSIRQLETAVDWLEQTSKRGRVYVHCSLGRSRTVMVCAAWLLRYGRKMGGGEISVNAALERIKSIRPELVLHSWHRDMLEEFFKLGSGDRSQ